MKYEEFDNVAIGDELYIQGRTSHRGQRGKVIEKYNRVAIMKFSEDDICPYHYNVLTTKPVAMDNKYDYIGRITQNNRLRNDDLIFTKDTFAECDGMKVPLVYRNETYTPGGALGWAILENREDGVYAKLIFNKSYGLAMEAMKMIVETGECDISFSANKVRKVALRKGVLVQSGVIRAVHVDFKDGLYKYYDMYIDPSLLDSKIEKEFNEELERLREKAAALGYELVKKSDSRG